VSACSTSWSLLRRGPVLDFQIWTLHGHCPARPSQPHHPPFFSLRRPPGGQLFLDRVQSTKLCIFHFQQRPYRRTDTSSPPSGPMW
jgi:hypothetical protein